MQFRGVSLQPSTRFSNVYSGDGRWMREYFVLNQKLVGNYQSYLVATFLPFKSPGAHVMVSASDAELTEAEFAAEAGAIMAQIARLQK